MSGMNPKVDEFLNKATKWQQEMKKLRTIILDCGLTEEYKWMHPCYTLEKKNVILIHEFKDYCALLFHKGVLLKDDENLLVQQTENVQSERQIRFTNLAEIEKLESTIKAYIYEAIEIEKAGLKVKMKETSEFNMPEELQQKFKKNPDFKSAFENLTQGMQRGYLLHFSQPKQSKTRETRVKKYIQQILDGKGFND